MHKKWLYTDQKFWYTENDYTSIQSQILTLTCFRLLIALTIQIIVLLEIGAAWLSPCVAILLVVHIVIIFILVFLTSWEPMRECFVIDVVGSSIKICRLCILPSRVSHVASRIKCFIRNCIFLLDIPHIA